MGNGMTFQEFKTEVLNRIKKRNDELKSHFSTGKYEKMPGEFTLNTRIVTHEGEVIQGKDSQNYWKKVGQDLEGTSLNFKDPHIDAMEFDLGPEPDGEEINFIAIEITEFSFTSKGKEYRGYIDPPYRHRVRCTIDD